MLEMITDTLRVYRNDGVACISLNEKGYKRYYAKGLRKKPLKCKTYKRYAIVWF